MPGATKLYAVGCLADYYELTADGRRELSRLTEQWSRFTELTTAILAGSAVATDAIPKAKV